MSETVEVVIKIPEELYKVYKGRPPMLGDAGIDMIAQSIAEGTPLPKGHGVLKDTDKIISDGISKGFCDWYDEIEIADVVIEADKEAEDETD